MCMQAQSQHHEDESDPVITEILEFLLNTLTDKLEGCDNATFLKTLIKSEKHCEYTQCPLCSKVNKLPYIQMGIEGLIKKIDKTALKSSRALLNCSNYAIGIFQDGELHIVLIKRIVQMHPRFSYLDQSDIRVREEAKNMGEEYDEEEEGPKQIIKFSEQDNPSSW